MTEPTRSSVGRIVANMAKLSTGKVAAGVISLAYIALAARMLGVEQYGVLNLVHGYATFIGGVVAFSGFHGMVRYGAAALERGAHGELFALVRLMTLIELGMAAIAIVLAVALVPFVGRAMQWSEPAIELGSVYCLAILATVRTTPHGILQLGERFDLIGAHQIVMPAIRVVGAGAIWLFDGGLSAFLIVWLLGALAEGVSMWVMGLWVLRRMPLERDVRVTLGGARRGNPGLGRFLAITNLDLTLRDLAPRATPLIVGWVLGPAASGLFTLAHRASAVLYQPAQMLGQSGYPVIARLFAAGRFHEADHATERSVRMATVSSVVVAVVMAAFGRQIMTLLGGAGFAAGAGLLALIAIGRALAGGMPTLSAALTALGRPGASVTANLVSNFALLPLLAPMLVAFGIAGAGFHVIAQAIVLVVLLRASYARTVKEHERPRDDARVEVT